MTPIIVLVLFNAFLGSALATDGSAEDGFILHDKNLPFSEKGSIDWDSYFEADQDFLIRQRAILKAFHHYRCPNKEDHGDFYELSQTYKPTDHLDEYRYPELVRRLVASIESGTMKVMKNDAFGVNTSPLDDFQDMSLILEDAFVRDASLFYKTMAYLYSRVNIQMLYTGVLAVASAFRTDEGYRVPPPFEVIPQLYTPKDVIYRANRMNLGKSHKKPVFLTTQAPVPTPEPELSGFRDDPYINSFHIIWHVEFPVWYNRSLWKQQKWSQGELFLNMHHNMMGRYRSDRIASGLGDLDEMDFNVPIPLGVNPNILRLDFQEFPPRPANYLLQQNYTRPRDDAVYTRKKVSDDKDRMLNDLRNQYLLAANGTWLPMYVDEGTDVLGSVMESNWNSVNPERYGDMHNSIHQLIGLGMDPDGKLRLPPSTMSHQETAISDTAFYRVHKLIDNTYKIQQDLIQPYCEADLALPGVKINSLNVQLASRKGKLRSNQLVTFFRNISYDITNAISETDNKCHNLPKSQIFSNMRQLNHQPFNTLLNITSSQQRQVVVRIFMAPVSTIDSSPQTIDKLRWSFFEMDRFPVELKAGNNIVSRASVKTSNSGAPSTSSAELSAKVEAAYSGNAVLYVNKYARTCGWPLNYHVPAGLPSPGMDFTLFAIITDFKTDFPTMSFAKAKRIQSLTMCGVAVGHNPDVRPLGFPFNRRIEDAQGFFNNDNMARTKVTVIHLENGQRIEDVN